MSNIEGKVVSIIDDKTVKVAVINSYAHEKYKKIVKRVKNYLCHDPECIVQTIGQSVLIKEGKPVSKLKSWYVIGTV